MKATFDIPDDLYRRARARSAMEGRPLRSVAVELFQNWLSSRPAPASPALNAETPLGDCKASRFDNAPWVEIVRPYVRPGMSHGLDEMNEAITRGWGEEAAAKFGSPED